MKQIPNRPTLLTSQKRDSRAVLVFSREENKMVKAKPNEVGAYPKIEVANGWMIGKVDQSYLMDPEIKGVEWYVYAPGCDNACEIVKTKAEAVAFVKARI